MAHSIPQCGIDLIRKFEGCELTAYPDTGGKLTIGWGHTGADVYKGLTITQDQADELQVGDLNSALSTINNHVVVPLTEKQVGALLSFIYNVGSGNFSGSTLLRLLNTGEYKTAANEFPKWNHSGGVPSIGLARRRTAEQALFNEA